MAHARARPLELGRHDPIGLWVFSDPTARGPRVAVVAVVATAAQYRVAKVDLDLATVETAVAAAVGEEAASTNKRTRQVSSALGWPRGMHKVGVCSV